MADDLELDVRSVAGEGPSPEFVASLRERVLAEAAAPRAVTDDGEIIAVGPRPTEQEERSMTTRHWMLAGTAAAAVIALIFGLVVVAGGDDVATVDELTTVATSAAPTTESSEATAPTTTAPTTTVPTTEADREFDFDNDVEVLETALFKNAADEWEGVILVKNAADSAITLEARVEMLAADGAPLDDEPAVTMIPPGETTAFTNVFADVPAAQEPAELRLTDESSSFADVSGTFTLSEVGISVTPGPVNVDVLFTNDTDVDLRSISAVFVARDSSGDIIVARRELRQIAETPLAIGESARLGGQLPSNIGDATVEAYAQGSPAE